MIEHSFGIAWYPRSAVPVKYRDYAKLNDITVRTNQRGNAVESTVRGRSEEV